MSKLPQSAQEIIDKLNKAGFECFAVGGSVRDILMRKETKGWDFTTNATPNEIMKIFPDSFYDNNFGTVGIKMTSHQTGHPELPPAVACCNSSWRAGVLSGRARSCSAGQTPAFPHV